MNLSINGTIQNVEAIKTVADLVSSLGLGDRSFAIALNMTFIPKHSYSETPLHHGDQLDIVVPSQGG